MDRYDGNPGKERAIANTRQARMEAEHSAKNAFVKKQQAELSRHAGVAPKLEAKDMMFNATMMNDGMHAQEVARDVTVGMDKVAFPLK